MSISNSCKTIASLLCIAASALAVHAQDGRAIRRIAEDARRVALVVGNDAYAAQPLQNAANDARDMGRLLEDFGFEVEVVVDASRKDFSKAVDRFADRLGPGAVGFFFYAGHAKRQRWTMQMRRTT